MKTPNYIKPSKASLAVMNPIRQELITEVNDFMKKHNVSRNKIAMGSGYQMILCRLERGCDLSTGVADAIYDFMEKYEGKK